MCRLLVAFTTDDGHTAKIAERIALKLRENDCSVEVCDLVHAWPELPVHEYKGVISGGPLHRGKHHPKLFKFATQNCRILNERPSAFFSVSLSAAGRDEQQDDATRCLEEFLRDTGWNPSASTIIAGALLYQKYGFFKRWMMKMIIKRGGTGDTDTSRNYVYTDWDAVDGFARRFLNEHIERPSDAPRGDADTSDERSRSREDD